MAKRNRDNAEVRNCDIISELPESLIECVLGYLPIRDAVRTCVLSTKWRNKWTSLPKIVFDDSLFLEHQSKIITKELLFMMYKILLQKKGPTREFYLDVTCPWHLFPDINTLVDYTSGNNLEKLHLAYEGYGAFRPLRRSVFSCLRLTHLHLAYIVFNPPLSFKGFSCLTSLKMEYCSIDDKTLVHFISSCPLLERLTLGRGISLTSKITAPNLKYFHFNGDNWSIDSFDFSHIPLLADIAIYPTYPLPNVVGVSSFIDFFKSLASVKNLGMHYRRCKAMLSGDIPDKLQNSVVGLTNLFVSKINLGKLEGVQFLLCLIRSSPNLRSLSIQLNSDVDDVGVEDAIPEECLDLCMNKLRKIEIRGVRGTLPELKFIKV